MKIKRNILIINLFSLLLAGCSSFQFRTFNNIDMPPVPPINNSSKLLEDEPQLADWIIAYKILNKKGMFNGG